MDKLEIHWEDYKWYERMYLWLFINYKYTVPAFFLILTIVLYIDMRATFKLYNSTVFEKKDVPEEKKKAQLVGKVRVRHAKAE